MRVGQPPVEPQQQPQQQPQHQQSHHPQHQPMHQPQHQPQLQSQHQPQLQPQHQPQHQPILQPQHQQQHPPRQHRQMSGKNPYLSGKNPYLSETNLYVEGIPREWVDMDLQNHFQSYGQISAVRILMHKETNMSREVGFIHFVRREDACLAMNEWQEKKPFPTAERAFKIKFANKGKKDGGPRMNDMSGKYRQPQMDYYQPQMQYQTQPQYSNHYDSGGGYGKSPKFNEICRYFQRGNCRRGQNCFYRHNQSTGIKQPYYQPQPPPHYYPHEMPPQQPYFPAANMYQTPMYYDTYGTGVAAVPAMHPSPYTQLHGAIDPSMYYQNYYGYPPTAVVHPANAVLHSQPNSEVSNPYAEAWENYYAHKYGGKHAQGDETHEVQAQNQGVQGTHMIQKSVVDESKENVNNDVTDDAVNVNGNDVQTEKLTVMPVKIEDNVQETKVEVNMNGGASNTEKNELLSIPYGPSHGTARQQSSAVTISTYDPIRGQKHLHK